MIAISRFTVAALLGVLCIALTPASAFAQTARVRYTDAQAREAKVRQELEAVQTGGAGVDAIIADARRVMASYSALVRRFPISGYSDNALFNAGDLAAALHSRFGEARDRDSAITFFTRLTREYPASSLIRRASDSLDRLRSAETLAGAPVQPSSNAPARGARARLVAIDRVVLPEAVRITLQLDREVPYHEEKLASPARVFFDLRNVEAAPELTDAVLRYPSEAVRQIRIGRHPNSTVRVVLDLEGVNRHTVYALYNPFRLVIDCEPAQSTAVAGATGPAAPATPPAAVRPLPAMAAPSATVAEPTGAAPASVTAPPPSAAVARPVPALEDPAREAAAIVSKTPAPASPTSPAVPLPAPVAPEAPSANRAGGFSIARQLGLGVSRIVVDPGHGGHDPGAQARGVNEADVTLDIALRLEELLAKEAGLEVVLTRRTDVYVPLEERTAIANRENADLFLSIHANASRNASARGVETYFLSFAATPEAEAVAARENSSSASDMRRLPELIKTITLNNKLDESKDFAGMVQEALVSRLRRSNSNLRNLGVKKAPFVVLIGAGMPSVLAEVSFLTNRQELQLLKMPAYKQRIAEALHAAVMRYRRSLKGQGVVAAQ